MKRGLDILAEESSVGVEDNVSDTEPGQKEKRLKGGSKIPVTILSGFLGAGKTTLLQNILENEKDCKFGVIVNDVAEVNIDSKLIKKSTQGNDNVETVQLQNGCACCSASDDLFVSIRKVLSLGDFDHILIECTGLAEPKRMWSLLDDILEEEEDTVKVCLSQLVTVVDSHLFFDLFKKKQEDEDSRFICDLLSEQIECADIVLANKQDLLGDREEEIQKVVKTIEAMNPVCTVVKCTNSEIDLKELFETKKKKNLVLGDKKARHLASLGVDQEHAVLCNPEKLKEKTKHATCVKSFVYKSRKPFDPKKFAKFLIEGELPKGLLRSKGYCWLANHCDMAMYWSQSGIHRTINPIGAWWACIPESEYPSGEMPKEIKQDWEPPYGDRRQEIVFIGLQELDQIHVESSLNKCLIHDENEIKKLL